MPMFGGRKPLLSQLKSAGFQFDQQLTRALEVSASKPDLRPEDKGFPDSYLTLALYRLNTLLTRMVELDERRYNLFHEYKLAPPCKPEEVIPGSRLCGVLDKAIELAKPKSVIGVGHFLKAIVALSLDEPAWDYMGATIHNTFSVETLLWGLGYSAWTNLKEAPEVTNMLESLGGRDPIQDHQYLLAVEKGRLVFRTVSVLDPYIMETQDKATTRLGLLTHFNDAYVGFLPTEILELEDLINHPKVKESELQSFLERHPKIFRMWDYRDVYAQVYLTHEDDGDLIPDFVLVDPLLQRSMILDLKLPTKQVVVGRKNRRRFSAPLEEAKSQLLRYKDWFEDRHNRIKIKEQFGMEIFRPSIGVVIGRRSDFDNEFERQQIASDNPQIEVVTYDDILEFAKRRILLIQQAGRD